jgi:hypothetical protein
VYVNIVDGQYSIDNQKNLSSFGADFIKFVPIEDIGLDSPVSLVNSTIRETRNKMKNLYYEA